MTLNKEQNEIMERLIRDEIEVIEFILNEGDCDPEDRELNEIKKLDLEAVLEYFI